MSKPLIILGNGGHASVLMETLFSQGQGNKVLGFTNPNIESNAFNLDYLGPDEVIYNYSPEDIELILGLGMLGPYTARKKIFTHFKEKGYSFKSIVHSAAVISSTVKLAEGVQIMAGAILQTGTNIADNTIINTGAIIDHDGKIGAHVHIAPGTKISGAVQIGDGTHIGTGTTIIQGIKIGENCLIGAGSVVVKNMQDNIKAFGVPAKEV